MKNKQTTMRTRYSRALKAFVGVHDEKSRPNRLDQVRIEQARWANKVKVRDKITLPRVSIQEWEE